MDLSAVTNPTLATKNVLQLAQPADASSQFEALMHKASGSSQDQLEDSARQLIGLALFKPLLAQAHDSAFKTDLFHGGAGEDAFQGQLDQVLADRMSQRADFPLVKAMVAKFTAHSGTAVKAKVDAHG